MIIPALFVSLRSSYSSRNHLVCAKFHPLIRKKGSSCCWKSRCETCLDIQEIDTFQSFVKKEVYKVKHHVHCDSKYLIYLISCKLCGLQYVGSAVDRFCLRWNNYKCSQMIVSEGCTPKKNYSHQHFLSETDHVLLVDCEIRLTNKTDPFDPTRRDFFRMRKVKTLAL